MFRKMLLLLGLISLGGACKKEEPEPLKPTSITLQVIYQQTGLPVDSAEVAIFGTKGTYLSGAQYQTFQRGYTDRQGRFEASMLIPLDYYTRFTAYKLIKVGNHYPLYSLSVIEPRGDVLKHGQENIIVAQLDTLK